jgi:integral membrane protein
MSRKKRLKEFRIIAIIEGLSFLAFGITMPLKYIYEITEPNYVIGMLHGLVFLLYILLLLILTLKKYCSLQKGILFFIASLLPFGTFYMDYKYLKPGILK